MAYFRNLLCFSFLIIFSFTAKSQDIGKLSLREVEDSLSVLEKQIFTENSFSIKEVANSKFQILLKNSLASKEAFDYPFDSLKHIGIIKSEDEKIKIFTWNLPQSGGSQVYFGFILLNNGKGNIELFELNDNRKKIANPIKEILDRKNWMGALYYSIIDVSYDNQTYYVLLGLDFNNLFSSKKLIEILKFGKDSEPIFGSELFKIGDALINRVIFEFSARTSMSLRYVNNSKTIVFDHLSPSRPDFEGNYQFYGPDFTYDGFKFEKGYWVYVRNLDLRNPRREPPKLKESPEKLPDPGFLYKSKGGLLTRNLK